MSASVAGALLSTALCLELEYVTSHARHAPTHCQSSPSKVRNDESTLNNVTNALGLTVSHMRANKGIHVRKLLTPDEEHTVVTKIITSNFPSFWK
eukprot:2556601-Amphidinium_carterae.1